MPISAARRIAEFSVGFGSFNPGADLFERTGRALLDTYAVGVAGAGEDASQRALRYIQAHRADVLVDGVNASLWGRPGFYPIESAALWNGIAAHVLDYDDVTSPLRGHPSVALLPALVALAQAFDASGTRLTRAYAVGFEVTCKIARSLAVEHYAKGWHSTASIGTLGAALACAHLLDLDVAQTISAIGLAVAQAAGTRANFGAHAKSFQAGHANAAGLRAALLAREGFTAAEDALDGDIGYVALYGNGELLDEELATLGTGPLELERSGIEVKKYPLCYATHRALDGVLDLRAQHGLTLEDVERVVIRTSQGALTPLVHHRPVTGLQGKFSMEYAVSCALLDGWVKLESFTDEAVARAPIQQFLSRVDSAGANSGGVFPRWTEITIHRRDGTSLNRRIASLRGSAQLPLTLAELGAKAADCLAWGASQATAESIMRAALSLSALSVRDFLQAAQASPAGSGHAPPE
jgi:2-methylcitrate dehydratase PrpD